MNILIITISNSIIITCALHSIVLKVYRAEQASPPYQQNCLIIYDYIHNYNAQCDDRCALHTYHHQK